MGNGLLVAVNMPQLVEPCARQHQQILRDGQVVHIHHPQVRVVIAQVQHGGNIACMAVFKRHDAVSGIAAFHGIEHLIPGGIAHGLGVGEQRLEGNVGKRALHALIGRAVLAQHHGFVLLGYVHQVLHMVFIIGPQGGILNAGGRFFQHSGLAGGVVDGQAVGTLILCHLQHGGHPPLKQCGQLGVHRVDLSACLFQCVHGFTSFCMVDKYHQDNRYPVSIP